VIVQLKEALEQASAQASPLENPDYAAAKNEQSFIEGRILQLQSILKTAVLIDPSQRSADKVGLGSEVTIREGVDGPPEHYVVVGSVEADPLHGFISNASPLGRALMGQRPGATVIVNAPDGEIEFHIVAIE
jgi:transcription elongation factor GreA